MAKYVDEREGLRPASRQAWGLDKQDSFARSLLILEAVARGGPGITFRALNQDLNMPSSTLYRLVNRLIQDEYLVRLPNISGLALGKKMEALTLILGQTASLKLSRAALRLLNRIRQQLDFDAIHLYGYSGPTPIPLDADTRMPIHDVADELLSKTAVGQLWERVQSNESQDGSRNYAIQANIIAQDFISIAVPLLDAYGYLIASLCAVSSDGDIPGVLSKQQALQDAANELALYIS